MDPYDIQANAAYIRLLVASYYDNRHPTVAEGHDRIGGRIDLTN